MNKHSVRKFLAALSLMMGTGFVLTVGAQTQPTSTSSNATSSTTSTSSDDQTVSLEKYVVTGTYIPNAGEAMSIPVAVVTTQQMQGSGVETNLLDILRKVSPAVSGIGGENATTTSNSTHGGASASIHGLATLVLVDGLREAYAPVDASGGLEFVDLNQIPLAAVDHIEILSDGASAIYGADALGGVINIILKNEYNGWQVDSHYGYSDTTGHYSERSGDIVGGVSNGTTSITASVSYTQTDPITEAERPYTNPFYASTYYPGIIDITNIAEENATGFASGDEFYQLAPGVNAPPGGGKYTIQQLVAMGVYVDLGDSNAPGVIQKVESGINLAYHEDLAQAFKRSGFSIKMDHKIFEDNLVAFGTVIYSHVNTETQLNGQPIFPYISTPSGNSDLWFYGVTPPAPGTQYVPNNAPTNPFNGTLLDNGFSDGGTGGYAVLVHNRFVQDPRIFLDDDQDLHVVGGLKGKINDDWSWSVDADINTYNDYYTNPNIVDTQNLVAGILDGQLNPFAIVQAPGAYTGILGTGYINFVSTLNEFDAELNGSIAELPAGKLQFALGADINRQNLTASPDSLTATGGWDDSPTVLPFNRNRTVDSFFGELEVPLVDKTHPYPGAYALNLDLSGRYDDYTTIGSHSVPKVDIKYQPFDDQFTLRLSAGKSFIVPSMFDLYGPTTQGSSDLISYTTAGGTSIQNVQFQATGGSNPLLKPSTASNVSAGFVLTPKALNGLSWTLDYFQTVQHGLVGSVAQATIIQSVEDLGSASPYAGLIHFDSPTGPSPTTTTPGQISGRPLSSIYINAPLINLGAQAVKGFDTSLIYDVPRKEYGHLEFTTTFSVYNSYLLQLLPSENYYQYAGTVTSNQQAVSGQGGTIPRWRNYSTVEWKRNGWDALVGFTYVPTVESIGPGGSGAVYPAIPVNSYSEFDFSLGYNLGALNLNRWLDDLVIRVGVNNAFNKYPPLTPSGQENQNVDLATYNGPIGRMWFTDVSYKF
jgi:iron complex outermembrane recepter protein